MSHNPFEVANDATKEIASAVRQIGAPPSALYEGTIKAAYLIQNNWNTNCIDLAIHIELASGYEYKIQKTVLKDNDPYVVNAKTKKKELMFSYVQISHIIGAAIEGATLGSVFPSIQVKKIELYDFDAAKNVLTDVKMITDLVGKPLLIGLQRKISNKREKTDQKDANGRDVWLDLAERKETLEFGVAGNAVDRRSFTEFNNNVAAADATDLDKWEKMNTGKDWNAYKEVAGVAAGVPAGVAPTTEAVHDFSPTP